MSEAGGRFADLSTDAIEARIEKAGAAVRKTKPATAG